MQRTKRLLGVLFGALATLCCLHAATAEDALTATAETRFTTDFAYVSQVAPGSVGWLYQPDTTINQPLMYNADAEYYLRRQFNDHISICGAMFVTGDTVPAFDAPVLEVFGANCKDNSLFGSLSLYQDQEYYDAHPMLYLITPEGEYQLDIFAGVKLKHADLTSWRVGAGERMARLEDILAQSFFTPDAGHLPEEGDAWAVLSTESTVHQGSRFVLYARKRPLVYTTDQVVDVVHLEMDSRDTFTETLAIEGVGEFIHYMQDDPIWDQLRFEVQSCTKRRPFGDGGCGPTAVAMAIVNLVPAEELPKLSNYATAEFGYRFCSCSVNDFWCGERHVTYQLKTPEQFLRYFPLAVANFITGNNRWGLYGRSERFGTNMSYLEKLCEVYGIHIEKSYDREEWLAALQTGAVGVACTTGYGSPFTASSHFLTLAGADDEYLYVMDTLRRESYDKWDRKGVLEVLSPGFVRVPLELVSQCYLAPVYIATVE